MTLLLLTLFIVLSLLSLSDAMCYCRVTFWWLVYAIDSNHCLCHCQLLSSPQGLLKLAGPLINDGVSKPVATPGGQKQKRDADLALLKL